MNDKWQKLADAEIPPWERQPEETEKSFEYFCLYRDMGQTRSLQKVADAAGKAFITIAKVSEKWKWKERTKAWSDYRDRERRDAEIQEVRAMAKRHVQESMMLQKVLILPTEAILKRLSGPNAAKIKDFNGMNFDKLYDKAVNSATVFNKITEIERKSRGESDPVSKVDLTSGGETIRLIKPMIPQKQEDEQNIQKEDNDL